METPAPNQSPNIPAATLETVALDCPITRGDLQIDAVQLRKPKAGEMRGLQLQSIVQGDVNSMMALLPRITVPPLLPHEVEQLTTEDLGAMSGVVMGFFMSRADRAEMARILGLSEQKEPPKS